MLGTSRMRDRLDGAGEREREREQVAGRIL